MPHIHDKLEPADDTVQCLFFAPNEKCEAVQWEELRDVCNNIIKSLSDGYIWHRDEFKVYLPICDDKNGDVPVHLESNTCFEGNIEDEWFIVYLVLQISRQCPDVIVQVTDNDGDFLLIEAAEYLPSWANPDTTENRVFIYNSHIHLIPPNVADLNSPLTLQQALKCIIEQPEETRAAPKIEASILSRVGTYPDKLVDSLHRAVVNIPVDLAALLSLKPGLVAPIVTAYCNRDVIDVKSCKTLHLQNCVDVSVKFTKCLYAMLMHSGNIRLCQSKDKKYSLGVKLACGLHMIMSNASTDLFSSKQYKVFLNNLKQNGYFRDNIEGSSEYSRLLTKAKEYFASVECPVSTYVSNEVIQLRNTEEFVRLKESLLSGYVSNLAEDSDEWLNVNPEQLNDMLNKRYGRCTKLKHNDVLSAQAVTSELSNFLKQSSDFEGIELGDADDESNDINFDSEQFADSVQKMLKLLETGDPGDSDSDLFEDDDGFENQETDELHEELMSKLQGDEKHTLHETRSILSNIVQSVKEEGASRGPTSTILASIGIEKTDVLDSDDD